MRDSSDRQPAIAPANASSHKKRLGGYLVEAGLLTPGQIDVALNDQKLTGMRFGEILAARGWVKQQTIEYLMHKVVMPEQQVVRQPNGQSNGWTATQPQPDAAHATASRAGGLSAAEPQASKQLVRRDLPIAKPLPSAGKADGDISWAG